MRVYAEIDANTNKELEEAAISRGSNKKIIVAEAIDLYLHQDRSELDLTIKERDQLRSEQDLRWKEINQIRSELNATKRELEAARSQGDLMRSEREEARSAKDQASAEAEGLRRDLDHCKDTLRLKDDEISFLRGHLSQISEKIPKALPPSEEEAKKKRWYTFWK